MAGTHLPRTQLITTNRKQTLTRIFQTRFSRMIVSTPVDTPTVPIGRHLLDLPSAPSTPRRQSSELNGVIMLVATAAPWLVARSSL